MLRDESGVSTPALGELDVERHLRDPALKARLVRPLFELVAPRYDRFTRLFSFGMDRRWKRALLTQAAAACPADGVVLDVACGTGDLAVGMLEHVRASGVVFAMDVSRAMLALASARTGGGEPGAGRVRLARADMGALPLPDACVDVVTAGYAVRNASDPHVAVREIARVLRPGGVLVGLDFFKPAHRLWRAWFLGYLRLTGRLVGAWWHGEPVVYGYIADSIAHFLTWGEYVALLGQHGLLVERTERHLLGGIVVHRARRWA